MFISITNHNLTPEQLSAGQELAGKRIHLLAECVPVKDIQFPPVDVSWYASTVWEKAADLLESLNLRDEYGQEFQPHEVVIHIMGEMGFVYAFVAQATERGFFCVHSVTERIAEERDGIKTSRFVFRGYREYVPSKSKEESGVLPEDDGHRNESTSDVREDIRELKRVCKGRRLLGGLS